MAVCLDQRRHSHQRTPNPSFLLTVTLHLLAWGSSASAFSTTFISVGILNPPRPLPFASCPSPSPFACSRAALHAVSSGQEPSSSDVTSKWNIVKKSDRIQFNEDTLEKDCEISFFRASGAGGQHRNKVETAVRVVHTPTGMTATAADTRSQWQNRQLAFERLRDKLRATQIRKKERVATRTPKKATQARIQDKKSKAAKKQNRGNVRQSDW